MENKKLGCLLFILVLAVISWGVYEFKYQYSYYKDLKDKPWAYSRDENAKLLVDQWQGSFTDPNGVVKSLDLEVFVPTTDEERKKNAAKTRRHKRSIGSLRKEKRHFDGVATVLSTLGEEKYNFYGYVDENDFHQFKLSFGDVDENKRLRSNFNLNLVEKGNWQSDELTMELNFTFTNKSGSSYWDSANPKHQQTALVKLHRK
jgi:hypothetical protein